VTWSTVLNLLAWGLTAAGLALLVRAWIGDRARGRRRCAACWYAMEGAAREEEPGLLRCPECGRESAAPDLGRTRRSPTRFAVAGLVLAVAYGCVTMPRVRRAGWIGAVPTWALILGAAGRYPDDGTLPGWRAAWLAELIPERLYEPSMIHAALYDARIRVAFATRGLLGVGPRSRDAWERLRRASTSGWPDDTLLFEVVDRISREAGVPIDVSVDRSILNIVVATGPPGGARDRLDERVCLLFGPYRLRDGRFRLGAPQADDVPLRCVAIDLAPVARRLYPAGVGDAAARLIPVLPGYVNCGRYSERIGQTLYIRGTEDELLRSIERAEILANAAPGSVAPFPHRAAGEIRAPTPGGQLTPRARLVLYDVTDLAEHELVTIPRAPGEAQWEAAVAVVQAELADEFDRQGGDGGDSLIVDQALGTRLVVEATDEGHAAVERSLGVLRGRPAP